MEEEEIWGEEERGMWSQEGGGPPWSCRRNLPLVKLSRTYRHPSVLSCSSRYLNRGSSMVKPSGKHSIAATVIIRVIRASVSKYTKYSPEGSDSVSAEGEPGVTEEGPG